MFYRLRAAGFLLVTLAFLSFGCQKQNLRPLERILVVPFENHSSNTDADWMGQVIPFVLIGQSAGADGKLLMNGNAPRDAAVLRTTQLLEGYYIAGPELRVHAVLRDMETGRIVKEVESRNTSSVGLAPVLQLVAAMITPTPHSFTGADPRTLELIGRGHLEQAVASQPGSALAVLQLAERQIQLGEIAAARRTLETTVPKLSPGWQRAQLELLLARIEGDRDRTLRALQSLAASVPNNSDIIRQLGETLVNRGRVAEGIPWLRKTADLEPDQTANWNLLAYANGYLLQEKAAMESLDRYRKLAPDDPNFYDTNGEIHWFFGRFSEAEKSFLTAQEKSPQFLGGQEFAKAAMARFLAGDMAGADQVFNRFLETRRALKDNGVEARLAHWLRLTGRADKALSKAGEIAAQGGDLGAIAEVFRGLWLLESGQRQKALEAAHRAVSMARGPNVITPARVVELLAQPPANVEAALQAQGPLRELILAYSLLLGKRYQEVAKVLEGLYDLTPRSSSDDIRMMLGFVKLQLGDKQAAQELLRRYPLPPQPGEAVFASLWFPSFLEWRKSAGL